MHSDTVCGNNRLGQWDGKPLWFECDLPAGHAGDHEDHTTPVELGIVDTGVASFGWAVSA